MPKDRPTPRRKRSSRAGTFRVKTLEQARVLSDPLRFRILQAFVKEPRTTKQVADRLGEKAPRLYRHVEALRRAGFLELIEERKKRGTVERYLQAVATRFEVDRSLFDPGATEATGEPDLMIRTIFDTTEAEARRATASVSEDTDTALLPIVARFGGTGTTEQLARLRAKLVEWLAECEDVGDPSAGERHHFAGLIAFYQTEDSSLD